MPLPVEPPHETLTTMASHTYLCLSKGNETTTTVSHKSGILFWAGSGRDWKFVIKNEGRNNGCGAGSQQCLPGVPHGIHIGNHFPMCEFPVRMVLLSVINSGGHGLVIETSHPVPSIEAWTLSWKLFSGCQILSLVIY